MMLSRAKFPSRETASSAAPRFGGSAQTILITCVAAVCVGALCNISIVAQESQPPRQMPPVNTTPAADKFYEIVLPAQDGRIEWDDVAAALSKPLSLDTAVVRRLFPTEALDLNGSGVLLTLLAVDVAMGDSASIKMTHTDDGQLAVKIRARIPQRADAKTATDAILDLDSDWRPKTATRPLVVCVHGIGGATEVFDGLRGHLREKGYATASVSYHDSASIANNAAEISELVRRQFQDSTTQPRLALIGHSAGGLVTREWTENPKLANDDIATLITVGTPHLGSSWASMPPLLDFVNKGKLSPRELVGVLLHVPSSAGLRDIEPGSDMLRMMNSRQRRRDVAYTSIIGTASPMKATEVAMLRKMMQQLDQDGSFVRLIRPRIRPLLENFEELSSGTGDGVVAVSSAKIPGGDDTVEIPLGHSEILHLNPADSTNPTWVTITDRLNKLSGISKSTKGGQGTQ